MYAIGPAAGVGETGLEIGVGALETGRDAGSDAGVGSGGTFGAAGHGYGCC